MRTAVPSIAVAGALAAGLIGAGPSVAATSKVSWPVRGQAAYVLGNGRIVVSPHERETPIASVAKVMTALLVLRAHPLRPGSNGFSLTVTTRDVADTARRRGEGQSVVAVRAGERLTERQALAALLLPSANNVAVMLARRVAGKVGTFVWRMNRTAKMLGMLHTRYTDPSGYAASTVSTARDQLVLVQQAMTVPAFRWQVRRRTATIPVAGRIRSTDALLGRDGFVGVKTGSDSAAGGCFAFRSWHRINGRETAVTGVVLGQPGTDLIAAGLTAAKRLTDEIVAKERR